MKIGHRQHVGDVERLPDISLTLHFTHQQGVAADAIGALRHVDIVSGGNVHGSLQIIGAAGASCGSEAGQ
jgi:hypothetical protein